MTTYGESHPARSIARDVGQGRTWVQGTENNEPFDEPGAGPGIDEEMERAWRRLAGSSKSEESTTTPARMEHTPYWAEKPQQLFPLRNVGGSVQREPSHSIFDEMRRFEQGRGEYAG